MSIITRFAPSPTGLLHIGNARTASIAWLLARSHNGKFILRIDDTDKTRSEERFVEGIKEDLTWLGLNWDETFRQSERFNRYQEAKEALIAAGRLYPCYESQEALDLKRKNQLKLGLPPLYDRAALKLSDSEKKALEAQGIKPHWRFLLEPGTIAWNDLIKGSIEFQASNVTDPILFKADGSMTFTLASVVDDLDFGITDIVRGEDHLTNSATHLQLLKALGAKKLPRLGHLSLMVSKKGEISKRLGGFDIKSLREMGIEPMTINSFLAKIGTSDPLEITTSLESLISNFDLKKASKSPINYDSDDLLRLNAKLLHKASFEEIKKRVASNITQDFWAAVHCNISSLKELEFWHQLCFGEMKKDSSLDGDFLATALSLLPEIITSDTWKAWTNEISQVTGKKGKELFLPLRLAITGLASGPEMNLLLPLIPRDSLKNRLSIKS